MIARANASERPVVGRPVLAYLVFVVAVSAVVGVALTAVVLWRTDQFAWGAFIWLGAFYLMAAIRVPYVIVNAGNTLSESRSDSLDRVLLAGVAVTGVVLPVARLATPWLNVADYSLPDWATVSGVGFVTPALWLIWRAHVDLGANWSPSLELREGHTLITRGAYRYIRHPMYAGIWLWCLAQPLLIPNWLGGALIVPAFALLYFVRLPREEAMMREHFGAVYEAYEAKTGRLLPKLFRRVAS